MGDDGGRAAAKQWLQRRLDQVLGLRVEVGRGLVQDQDARILEDDPGDRHPLLLATAQPVTALPHHRVVAVRERRDELVRVGGGGGGDHLGLGRVRPCIQEVLPHAGMEQVRVLENHPNLLPERLDGQVADVVAVDPNGALLRVVEAGQQARHRGLAGAARPHQGGQLAGIDGKRHIPQRRFDGRRVGEGHLLEGGRSAGVLQDGGTGPILDLDREIEIFEQPLEERQRPDHVDLEIGQRRDRSIQAAEQDGGKGHHHADRGLAGEHQVATEEPENGGTGGPQHAHQHEEPASDHRLADVEVAQVRIQAPESGGLAGLGDKRLDQQDAGDAQHFLHVGGQLRELALRLFAGVERGPAHPLRRQHKRRDHQ